MRKDLILNKTIYSPFLSLDKDIEKILELLFITSKPYSDILKRLLIINNSDCLDTTNQDYKKIIDSYSLSKMIEQGYIRLSPKITRGTHQNIKTYIIVSLDNFTPNRKSSKYRDYNIFFDIVCYNDAWVLNDYKIRPLVICGYIDGILNSLSDKNKVKEKNFQSYIKLTGIGQYEMLGCNENVLNEALSMYTLSYHGTHFSEDIKDIEEVYD